MSATAKHLPGAEMDMDETVVYQSPDRSGPDSSLDQPPGSSAMFPSTHSFSQQAAPQGRYTFGSGARPLEGYTIKRAIGRGGFGEVYYATSDSGKEVALKLILRNLDVERRGVLQCMNLKCPNLLTIYDLKTSEAGDGFVVMEYVAGPSLATVLKEHPAGMPLAEVRHWLRGLIEGVAYLHDHGIVHRDLKPANLFMEEGIVKIGDYGLAKLITPGHGTEHSESIGTCHYMAPEIGSGKYYKPIDIYAIGVILYEMLTGRVPFDGETVNEVLMKHLTSRPDLSIVPEPFRAIVGRALAKYPNHRPKHVYELLPSGDAPRSPEIRIIGEGKKGPAGAVEAGDDVLRIEAEEPVFYIGPETRPPGSSWQGWLRSYWAALRRPIPGRRRVSYRPPSPAGPAAGMSPGVAWRMGPGSGTGAEAPAAAGPSDPSLRRASSRLATAQPGSPVRPRFAFWGRSKASAVNLPPEPPPSPSGRVRFAELAASMLWATPLLAILTIPAAALLGIDPGQNPQEVVYLFGLALLGTWTTLIPAKTLEARTVDSTTRRLVALGTGLFMGVLAIALGQAFRVRLAPQRSLLGESTGLAMAYFGLLYGATNGWSRLTARDRPRRFRVWPILGSLALAAALTPIWSFERPDGLAVASLIAITSQLVSPWSEPAARYARYVRLNSRGRTNNATA